MNAKPFAIVYDLRDAAAGEALVEGDPDPWRGAKRRV